MNQVNNRKITLSVVQQDILDKMSSVFREYGYQNIQHKRISYELPVATKVTNSCGFQGLTRASYLKNADSEYIQVILKWFYYRVHNGENLKKSHEFHINKRLIDQLSRKSLMDNSSNNQCLVLPMNIHESVLDGSADVITLPYYPLGSVKQVIQDKQKQLDGYSFLLLRQSFIKAIISSVTRFHQLGWVHGDIKPTNILVNLCNLNKINKKKAWQVQTRLADFSVSLPQQSDSIAHGVGTKITTQGTPAYLAPECWHGLPASIYSDYYALGITLIEIIMAEKLSSVIEHCYGKRPQSIEEWRHFHCQVGVLSLLEDVVFKDTSYSFDGYKKTLSKLLVQKSSERGMEI